MRTEDNNILMILLRSGRKLTFSVPAGEDHVKTVRKAISLEGLKKEDIKRYYYIDSPGHSPTTYQDHFNIEEGHVDELLEARVEKLKTIRRHRSMLLNKLDVQFMMSLEDDCSDCTNHIKEIKQYLRDLPSTFQAHDVSSLKEIIDFNVFDNVFDFTIANPGSGYTTPPTITVSSPNGRFPGFTAQAEAEIENGSVCKIITTHVGSSYSIAPTVTVSLPDEEGGTQAYVIASEPENNIYTYLELGAKNRDKQTDFFYKKPE